MYWKLQSAGNFYDFQEKKKSVIILQWHVYSPVDIVSQLDDGFQSFRV